MVGYGETELLSELRSEDERIDNEQVHKVRVRKEDVGKHYKDYARWRGFNKQTRRYRRISEKLSLYMVRGRR